MKLAVITPVGPDHGIYISARRDEVSSLDKGPFSEIEHVVIEDYEGKLGRSKARNIGMESPADWYFFLDADDSMRRDACNHVSLEHTATFGAISFRSSQVAPWNVFPASREQIFEHGPRGMLSMGFFLRGDYRGRWNENMDVGEDYDFYMRLPDWTKVYVPLVNIGKGKSARGPRGYDYRRVDWLGECQKVIDGYKSLSGHALLGAQEGTGAHPGDLRGALRQ